MGRHLLQIPGPTNCPDEVLRAISAPTIDHRGPQFHQLATDILSSIRPVFGTTQPVVIYPSSGTGAWEAALVNTLSPGDSVLCFETGYFALLWKSMAESLGLRTDMVPGDWRHGISPETVFERLSADRGHQIKAVCCVHNETSTGIASRIPEIRRAIDEAGHPALLLVDTISSLAAMDFRHDEWGVDVAIAGSQKGLMLPPGLGFNAISSKALQASRNATLPQSYWNWEAMLDANSRGSWPYTPPTNLLFGLKVALEMLQAEGLPQVFARHARHARATRAAVRAWGLELVCQDEREFSDALTAVVVGSEHNADHLRQHILQTYDMSLGAGLGKYAGRVFRIGHLGYFNDLMLAGTLSGIQMGLRNVGITVSTAGVAAALEVLEATASQHP